MARNGRVLQPARGLRCAGASQRPVIRAALASRALGSPAAADVRRRLPIPGGVWEPERRAQREPGAARRGEDSGGVGGGGGGSGSAAGPVFYFVNTVICIYCK